MQTSARTGYTIRELRRANPKRNPERDPGRRRTAAVARCTARNRAIAEQDPRWRVTR